jgi:hypothetical protein
MWRGGYSYKGQKYTFKKHRDGARSFDRMMNSIFRMLDSILKNAFRAIFPRRGRRQGCCCCPAAATLMGLPILGILAWWLL